MNESSEEWISAWEAFSRVFQSHRVSTAEAIRKRAHVGLIKTKADTFVVNDGDPKRDYVIPKGFWWAKGKDALKQNWKSGDFDTWLNRTDHLQAFGVVFSRADIERMIPEGVLNAERPAKPAQYSKKVFIVHGRDEGPREAVTNLLKAVGLKPIILNTLPNKGKTVIEKIEAYSDVGFAIVLLTPDDQGGLTGDPLAPRARQNVLLELGYFLGKLGR